MLQNNNNLNNYYKMLEKISNLISKYKGKKISPMDTFDVLKIVKIISYIVGFRIIEYPPGHSRPILSFLYTSLLYIMYYIGWYFRGFVSKSSNVLNLEGLIFQIAGTISIVAIFVILAVGFHQSKSYRLSVRRIHEVDLTLRALGSPATFDTIYKRIILIILFILFYLILFSLLQTYVHIFIIPLAYKTFVIITSNFVYFFGQVVEHILILEFCTIVRCIDLEFQRANDLLSDVNILPLSSIAIELHNYKNSKDPFSKNKSSSKTSTKLFTVLPSSRHLCSNLQMTNHEIIRSRRLLQTIRQVHLELFRVSKRISMIYGMQASIVTNLCILYTTYFLYSLYISYQKRSCDSNLLIITVTGTSMLCFNNWMKIFTINYICGKTAEQAQRTNEIIYTFYGQNTDCELQEELEMFSLQMMHCRFAYSAAGLYSLNCKNICACLGFITTYVVIMIQVTNSIQEEVHITRQLSFDELQ